MFKFFITEYQNRKTLEVHAQYQKGDNKITIFGNENQPSAIAVLCEILNGGIQDEYLSPADHRAISTIKTALECIFVVPGEYSPASRLQLLQQLQHLKYCGIVSELPTSKTYNRDALDLLTSFTRALSDFPELPQNTICGYYYTFNTLSAFLSFAVSKAVEYGYTIKKCANCDKYFCATQENTTYCTGTAPQNAKMTCQQYGAYKNYNTNKPKYKTLHKQIYNTLAMRAKRTESTEDIEAVIKYYTMYNDFCTILDAGGMTAEELTKRLTEFKKHI